MRYALVDNILVEATPKSKGTCPGCSRALTAVCGEKRIPHWRHLALKHCDRWWEPETEWHRGWKSKFPKEWQEVFMPDPATGEKHMADVRTEHGLVIEFQHSHIDPEERRTREKFYQNMIWVVDGTRLKRDYPRFEKGMPGFRALSKQGFFRVQFPEEYFPSAWLESSVPVFFDFQSPKPEYAQDAGRVYLCCLLPGRAEGQAVIIRISKEQLVSEVMQRRELINSKSIVDSVAQGMYEQHVRQKAANQHYLMQQLARQANRRRYSRRSKRL